MNGLDGATTVASENSVLVADDNPLIVATIGKGLRAAGFEVLEAFTAASALNTCMERKPSLAIVDYAMPDMSGVELARLISERTSVPVIFLSAYSDEAIVREAVAAGAMTYLVKPIDIEQLLPVVRAALQRARELQALRLQADQLNTALQMSRDVSVATGVLMVRLQVCQQEAVERLRRYARSHRVRLEEIAAQLLHAADEDGRLFCVLSRGPGRSRRRDLGDTKE